MEQRLRETENGWEGSRTYLVNTANPYKALEAVGLPKINEAWNEQWPSLKCRARSIVFHGGVDDPAEQTGGNTRFDLEYAEPSTRSRLVIPRPGLAYLEEVPAVESVTQLFDVAGPDDPALSPYQIANGAGAPREVATLTLLVHVFLPLNPVVRAWDYLPFWNSTNAGPVNVPGPLGSENAFTTFRPGELRWRVSRIAGVQGNVRELVHELAAAPDHHFRWATERADGERGSEVVSKIYFNRPWPALY